MRVNGRTTALAILLTAILCGVFTLVVQACLTENMWIAGGRLMQDAWFRATLADCYGAFTIAWLAIALREPSFGRSLVWLVITYLTGSIGLAAYWLWALFTKPATADWRSWILAKQN